MLCPKYRKKTEPILKNHRQEINILNTLMTEKIGKEIKEEKHRHQHW